MPRQKTPKTLNNILLHLQDKWGLKSLWQVFIICLVFAITGSLSLKIGRPLLDILGIHQETMNPWVYWPMRLLAIFPIYQVVLIIVGALFGQFKFFWNIEKKMLSRIGFNFKEDELQA